MGIARGIVVGARSRMTRALCLGILVLLLLPGCAPASRQRPPAVLLFHGGGFCYGDPDSMKEIAELAENRGFTVLNSTYPLCDIGGAVQTAVRQAQRLRRHGYRTFAYGDSAGGTLAALLAERGLVEAAVAYAPASNLVAWPPFSDDEYRRWFRLDLAGRFRLSPAFHPSRRPILVLQGRDGFRAWNRRWAERDPLVRYRPVPGEHLYGGGPHHLANTSLGLNWLKRHANHRPPDAAVQQLHLGFERTER